MHLLSLNLNGLRAAARKGLEPWLAQNTPDFLCVQELKAQQADLEALPPPGLQTLAGLQGYFAFAQKKGYSGVGIYTRHVPSKVVVGFGEKEFDDEGRCIELQFDTPARKWSVLSVYFPSGSADESRQASKYRFLDAFFPYLMALKQQREFILCADINIAHHEIDLKNWKGNLKNSGFLPEERAWLTKLLDSGLVDVYRHLEPTTEAYTWWSQRGQAYNNNVGWRIDVHLATPGMAALAQSVQIHKTPRFSDHAVVGVGYALSLT